MSSYWEVAAAIKDYDHKRLCDVAGDCKIDVVGICRADSLTDTIESYGLSEDLSIDGFCIKVSMSCHLTELPEDVQDYLSELAEKHLEQGIVTAYHKRKIWPIK